MFDPETCIEKNFQPDPIEIFKTRNPTRTRKKIFFKPKPDPNPKKNFYITILALKIFKTAYNIRISIGYKSNFCQVFGINEFSLRLGSSKFQYFIILYISRMLSKRLKILHVYEKGLQNCFDLKTGAMFSACPAIFPKNR